MLERQQDKEDVVLKNLFASVALADDGFSAKLTRRLWRRLWLRRLAVPCAAVAGGLVAVKPATDLLDGLTAGGSLAATSLSRLAMSPGALFQAVSIAAALAVLAIALRLLED